MKYIGWRSSAIDALFRDRGATMIQHDNRRRRRMRRGFTAAFVIIAMIALMIFVGFNLYYLKQGV
ncbi:hypothetical protein [Sphingomonas lycopersici]|uniref:hypothetical protein n=1 Tax=Sphingomonas lycopersici TaxID=2951807 RepID=UPI0022375A91|nr:hypothetical protein [Sphingomonas lycopersici]